MGISDWSSDVCSSDLLWRHSVRCFGLQEHPQDPPFTVEVIGICAAESDRERSVNVANREAEGASLYPVDHDPQLRCIFLALRSNTGKDRALARGGKQRIARVEERFRAVAADLLQFEGKAAGDAKFGDRGGIEGKDHGFLARWEEANRLSDTG